MKQHENNHTVTFDFVNDNRPAAIDRPSFAGGRIDQFTSWGPTLDARMAPQISAPGMPSFNTCLKKPQLIFLGGSIFSTFPLGSGGWATFSGTSMATPYVNVHHLFEYCSFLTDSRLLALQLCSSPPMVAKLPWVTEEPSWPTKRLLPVANLSVTTTAQMLWRKNTCCMDPATSTNLVFSSVVHQGAGLVDAFKVVGYSTTVSPATLNLNDTDHFQSTHEVQVTNAGDESVTYQFYHEAGTTIFSKGAGDAWISLSPPYATDESNVATVDFSATELTLGPGESGTFSVAFSEPSASEAIKLPVYGGSILIVGSQGEAVRVTYMGTASASCCPVVLFTDLIRRRQGIHLCQ